MSERPGTLEARSLFLSSSSIAIWHECLRLYDAAVECVANGKSKNELVALDSFLWNDLVVIVNARDSKHITLDELANIMKWKLARGKARPLQKLVESNSNAAVITASTAAFSFLDSGKWEKAIEAISALKGIGVATATAVFAPFAPATVPFMADEVMEASTSCKRDYTLKVYREMRTALVGKSVELNEEEAAVSAAVESGDVDGVPAPISPIIWNAELVGKALWVRAMMKIYPDISNAPAIPAGVSKKGGSSSAAKFDGKQVQKYANAQSDSASGQVKGANEDSSSSINKRSSSKSEEPVGKRKRL